MKRQLKKNLMFAFLAGCMSVMPLTAMASKHHWNKPYPKNIIIMISDGCGFNHVDAASLYQDGVTGSQVYEKFPLQLAMSTYEAGQTYDPYDAWSYFNYVKIEFTDSAAAATAMSCGEKTYNGAIGVDMDQFSLKHIAQRAEKLGKATGVITSVEFSHATPAGFDAHNISRDNYAAIGQEMIYNSATDVIMGAGHPGFNNNGQPLLSDPNTWQYKYVGGMTTWADLIAGVAGNDADGDGFIDLWTLIQSREEFQNLMTGNTPKRVVGIAQAATTLQQTRGGDGNANPFVVPLIQTVPTLVEMTKGALNVLDNDPDGLFLMIEGGAIDWAAHANQSGRVVEEQIDFNRSVEAVVAWVQANSNWNETLLIITADHECGYLTGPGSGITPAGPVWNPLFNNGTGNLPGMEWHSGDHTNSLVPFYAKGKGTARFFMHLRDFDPMHGFYLDNTSISRVIFNLWR